MILSAVCFSAVLVSVSLSKQCKHDLAVQVLCKCSAARFHSVSFSKPNPVWFGKVTPKNCVQFSKPIPVWFGKKKIDFARRRFQTKFRLVWKILMTIVNVLKIPNQIQFSLEKSFTEVEHCLVGWSWHTFRWTSLQCSEVSVVHSCPEDSKHSSFISVEHSSEYSVAHSCVISSWQTSSSTSLHCSENSTEHLRPRTSWHSSPFSVLQPSLNSSVHSWRDS